MPIASIFNASTNPIKGLVTLPDASALQQGMYARIEGLRWDRALFRAKDGTVRLTSDPVIADGAFRGAWSGTLNGTAYQVEAYLVSGAVRLFVVTNFSTFASTEITASSGPYGNTRMSDAWCDFESVRDPFSDRDILLVFNGADAVRVYDPQGDDYTGDTVVAVHDTITPPSDLAQSTAKAFLRNGFQVINITPSHTNSASEFEGSTVNGSTDEQYILVTMYAAVDAGDTWIYNSTNTPNPSNGAWFYLFVETTYDDWINHVTIEFRKNGTTDYVTLFTAGGVHKTIEWDPTNDRYIVAVPCTIADQAYDRMRWTWVGNPPPTDQTLKLYGTGFAGSIQCTTEFGITYSSNAGRSESYGQVCLNVGSQLSAMNMTSLDNETMPLSDEMFVGVTISASAALSANAGSTDRIKIYMKPPGSFTFQYATGNLSSISGILSLSTWNGSAWADATSSGGLGSHAMQIGTNGRIPLNPLITMPDESHEVIPKAKYALSANGRLIVGNVLSASSEVWISKDKVPFHHRRTTSYLNVVTPDPRSPTSMVCETEIIQGFAAVPATSPTDPSNTVFIITDRSVTSIRGLDSYSLSIRWKEADVGSLSPRSITTYRRALLFLDADRQVRILEQGNLVSLTRDTLDDKFQAISSSRLDRVIFKVWRERLYVGYSSSGASTNDRVAGFNFFIRAWEFDEPAVSPCTAEGLLVLEDRTNNKQRLIAFGSDAKLYEYEQSGATQNNVSGSAANIAIRLTTGELLGKDYWGTLIITRAGVICDDVASGTLSVSATYKAANQVHTLEPVSIDVTASERAYRWTEIGADTYSNESRSPALGAPGPTVQLDFQGSFLGGKQIYSLVADVTYGDEQPEAV